MPHKDKHVNLHDHLPMSTWTLMNPPPFNWVCLKIFVIQGAFVLERCQLSGKIYVISFKFFFRFLKVRAYVGHTIFLVIQGPIIIRPTNFKNTATPLYLPTSHCDSHQTPTSSCPHGLWMTPNWNGYFMKIIYPSFQSVCIYLQFWFILHGFL